jgi:hypothetical protein
MQLPDSVKDFPKERLRHSHFRHLKYHKTYAKNLQTKTLWALNFMITQLFRP